MNTMDCLVIDPFAGSGTMLNVVLADPPYVPDEFLFAVGIAG